MTEDRLIKHRHKYKYENAKDIWIIRRDVDMTERYREIDFSLYRREGCVLVEGFDQTDNDWPAIR